MSKIIVVDDSYAELQVIEGVLKGANHTVVSFPNTREARRQGGRREARSDRAGRRHAGPQRLPGLPRPQERRPDQEHPHHPLYLQRQRKRQVLGSATGRQCAYRQAVQGRRTARDGETGVGITVMAAEQSATSLATKNADTQAWRSGQRCPDDGNGNDAGCDRVLGGRTIHDRSAERAGSVRGGIHHAGPRHAGRVGRRHEPTRICRALARFAAR